MALYVQGNSDIAGFVLFLLGIGFFWLGYSKFRLKRLIEDMPTSKMRSIAMGMVEVNGEAVPIKGRALKSPFSGNDCVYYRYSIEEYRHSGKHSRWVTISSGSERTPFFLKDDTGSVLVDPALAQIEIPADFRFQSGLGKDPPAMIKNFLAAKNMSFEGFLGINRQMRYTEYYIAQKDKLYILGTAADNPHVAEATAKQGVEDVMIQKGKGSVFYISDKGEREILKGLRWYIAGGLGAGSAMMVIGLIVIFLNAGLL